MPKRQVREGFAEGHTSFGGYRSKDGIIHRPGPAVFAFAAYAAWGSLPPGKAPVRLYRLYKWKGDRLGKYRLEAEYTWTLNAGGGREEVARIVCR